MNINIYYNDNPAYFCQLKYLKDNYKRQITRMLRAKGRKRETPNWKYEYLYNWIYEVTAKYCKTLPLSLNELVYWILVGKTDYDKCDNPKCTNKAKTFISHACGYSRHCCQKCAAEDPATKKQREETCLVVYKSKNVFSSDYGKKKIMETCLKNHGVPYSGMSEQKKKNTVKSNLKNYGVENVNQVPEIRQRGVRTAMKNNGQVFNYAQYKYNGIKFDSSWELKLYLYLTDKNINFKFHDTSVFFEYIGADNKTHLYYPDFIIEDKIYEIKGNQFFDKDGNPYDKQTKTWWKEKFDCMKANNVTILRESDLKPIFEYVDKTYGKDFCQKYKTSIKIKVS